jgi:uncharacterized protein (DUF885 family)
MLALLAGCATAQPHASTSSTGGAGGASSQDEATTLWALYAREWEWQLREFPGTATEVGDPRYNDRLEDRSLEAIANRKAHYRALQAELAKFDPGTVNDEARLNLELFRREVDETVEGFRFPAEYLAVDQFNGPQQSLTELAESQPRLNAKDLHDWIARLRAVPTYVDQTVVLLRRGVELGVVPARAVLWYVKPQIGAHVVSDPRRSPLYRLVLGELPPGVSPEEGAALRDEAATVIQEQVTPAFVRFQRYFDEEYLPRSREMVGWSALPDGREWYAFEVRVHTTLPLTPDAVHERGLAEVKRLDGELQRVKADCSFQGSLTELFHFLGTDRRFFYEQPAQLLAGYRDITKRIDPALVRLFSKLPRLPYGVSAVPPHAEQAMPAAYYQRGTLTGGRAGMFYANTSNLKTRPLWEMESLALHEAVPGHHLQLALAQEQESLPDFRRYSAYTAFVEGWALYAESLGKELGLYQNAYSRYGQLSSEMWRAIRLVVDTGLHAKGWSREQAIRYFAAHSGRPEDDIRVEVDRYIAWPGQALAYKIGQLHILALRQRAEQALGARFDVRAFHDFVLGGGALPLDVLERRVDAWIKQRATRLPGSVSTWHPLAADPG